jgi:hypothetical protein
MYHTLFTNSSSTNRVQAIHSMLFSVCMGVVFSTSLFVGYVSSAGWKIFLP